jgi:hypothetical protein
MKRKDTPLNCNVTAAAPFWQPITLLKPRTPTLSTLAPAFDKQAVCQQCIPEVITVTSQLIASLAY